jgi:hypothetical protein
MAFRFSKPLRLALTAVFQNDGRSALSPASWLLARSRGLSTCPTGDTSPDTHEVEADQIRSRGLLVEVAKDGIADVLLELGKIIRFREDRLSKSAGGIASFRRFLDDKDQLVHGLSLGKPLSLGKGEGLRQSYGFTVRP